jgi:hypothetical protein
MQCERCAQYTCNVSRAFKEIVETKCHLVVPPGKVWPGHSACSDGVHNTTSRSTVGTIMSRAWSFKLLHGATDSQVFETVPPTMVLRRAFQAVPMLLLGVSGASYTNPVIPVDFPDPCVVRLDTKS